MLGRECNEFLRLKGLRRAHGSTVEFRCEYGTRHLFCHRFAGSDCTAGGSYLPGLEAESGDGAVPGAS